MTHLLNYYDCYIEIVKERDEEHNICSVECMEFMTTELEEAMDFVRRTVTGWKPEENEGYEIVSWNISEGKL